jgi:transposase
MKILALDLGKFKSVFCLKIDDQKPSYGAIATERQSLHDLLVLHEPDRLVIEIGPSAGWVHDLGVALGRTVQVINTNDQRWQWKNVKEKSDRKDALKMVEMSRSDSLPLMPMPAHETRQWRSVINYRCALIDRRTQIKNSIRALFVTQGLALPKANLLWSKAGVKEQLLPYAGVNPPKNQRWRRLLHSELQQLQLLEEQIEKVTEQLDAIGKANARVRRLQTAPSVGPRLSEIVVAMIDDPHRFQNARQVGCYAGLTPRRWQSGKVDRRGHISLCGNAPLRKLLVEVAWIGVRNKTWMTDVFETVCRGNRQRRKVAIVAVARRLLVKFWAMMRDETDWKGTDLATLAKPGTAALAAGG